MTNKLNDHDSRQLALDVSRSFIVQAPAGSGKTELLIQRFLSLLATVKVPEEILAITFTKKAANEMRERIIHALQQGLDSSEPLSPHKKQTWLLARKVLMQDQKLSWHLLENPNQLRIQTIDSLCAYLTKQLPLLSHFGSQPDIADNADRLYREAVQEILSHLEEDLAWSASIKQLLIHLDNDLNKLYQLLIDLLKKRDQWLPYIQFHTNEDMIKQQLEAHLAAVISEHLKKTQALFPKNCLTDLLSILRFAAENLAQSSSTSEISKWRDRTKAPDNEASELVYWQGIAQLLLTKTYSWRKRLDNTIGFPALTSLSAVEKILHAEYRQKLTAMIIALNEQEELRQALSELSYLPKHYYEDQQWKILQALLQVLKVAAAQLRLSFQQHGCIDYIENTQAALSALGHHEHPTDLALALDYQIRHILVDEFQDTSFTQYQLLEKLIRGWEENDGRTLFVVGDPMQSIYRFREAEVALFIRMCSNGIGQLALTPLKLSVNFRSTSQIVNWNNDCFNHIFPPHNDIASGAVSYTSSMVNQANAFAKTNAEITIQGYINANDKIQAEEIISLIKMTKKNHPEEKIAILVRSRSHLSQIIPLLKKENINYRAIDIDPLASRQCVQDVFSLTCALLHPTDRIAWLAILRAPWCGLTLADLLIIAGHSSRAAIINQLENLEIIQKLSEDGKQRLSFILPILKTKMADREREDLRTWVESTWILLGGPACLEYLSDLDDIRAFFSLLASTGQHPLNLDITKLKEKMNYLYAAAQDDEALQIMTIHTAKGLEFDTVILPHLERKSAIDDKALLLWMEQALHNDVTALLLAPLHATGCEKDAIYEYIHRQQKIKADYETDRLLYVAATRAIKRLYLFYQVEPFENAKPRILSSSFLEKLWPFLEKNPRHFLEMKKDLLPADDPSHSEYSPRYLIRLNEKWKNPLHKNPKSLILHQQVNGFKLTQTKSQLIGIVTHRILQNIANFGINWWQNRNDRERKSYLQFHLQQLSMTLSDLSSALTVIKNAIQQVLQDERGQWILKPHQQAQSEFALSAVIDMKVKNFVIDRTFIDDHGIRWIIDYKTSMLTHHDMNDFLKKEQQKYLEKMQIYAEAMRHIDKRTIRLGLYFPVLASWIEWQA